MNQLNRTEPVLYSEFEAYPEAKLLSASNLKYLVKKYSSYIAIAKLIGVSEAFNRQVVIKLRRHLYCKHYRDLDEAK